MRLRALWRGARYAKRLLKAPIDPTRCSAIVQARVAERERAFFEMLERAVFAHPDSPYRPLLDAAGYDLPRIKALVAEGGIETTLRRMRDDGVYVSIEEFKGIHEARRGERVFRFGERAFDNPLTRFGLVASSGGTRSSGIPTTIPVDDQRMGAEHLMLALSAYGLHTAPVIVWLSDAHGASLWAVLALATARNTPPKWFTQLPPKFGDASERYLRYLGVRLCSRLYGIHLPPATHVAIGQESRILEWITGDLGHNACGVFTTPSSALRLALAARRAGASLAHVSFVTIGEPLTPMKFAAIRTVGARAFSSLGFTEFGRVTYGCVAPIGIDDGHVCSDAVAVIQRRRAVDHLGTEVDAYLFTALRSDARKILVNMETGDYGTMTVRRCGCPLDRVGWTVHLQDIRSFEKLNAEGRLFFGSQIISLVEERLPQQFGGDPTDYQLVEEEDEEGHTRLSLVAHPRLGPLDEEAVLACVGETFSALADLSGSVWADAGTIKVRRAAPMLTKAGKLMPLHHLRGTRK